VNTRSQLMDDAFTLAFDGQLNYTIVLELAQYLRAELFAAPWESSLKALQMIDILLKRYNGYDEFKVCALNVETKTRNCYL
jgi:hypothetical protein